MKRIQVGLSDETLALVEEQRGLVPRERWLRRVIEERVAVQQGGVLVPEPVRSTHGGYVSSGKVVTDLAPPPKGPAPGARTHEFQAQKQSPTRCGVCGVARGKHA